MPTYICFLTIIARTENILDAEINAASNSGKLLSASNNDVCITFICKAASNDSVQFAIDFDQYTKCYKNKTRCPNHDLGDLYFYLI